MKQGATTVKYPIGIQDFESLRQDNYLYIDKTELIYGLAKDGRYYFLSRPRRFGKSMLISTLDAYFRGKKELFEGLAIEKLESDWTSRPVLRFDFNSGLYDSVENLRNALNLQLNKLEELYGKGDGERLASERFGGIIERAYRKTGQKVAILVDEYDKPLLQNLDNKDLQNDMRREMKAFYSQLKTQDAYINFAFLTGVTKFSKVSIFSDLNNLNDLTISEKYETICGITKDELLNGMKDSIQSLADKMEVTYEEMVSQLTAMYDGYHFSQRMTDVFNPFSLLNAFAMQQIESYWFATGTPTFLIDLLRNNNVAIDKLDKLEMSARELGDIDNMLRNPRPLLYQTGYLTMKSYDPQEKLYTLGFPNEEVTDGFFNSLLPYYANMHDEGSESTIRDLRRALGNDDIDTFMLIMQSFFAGYDYSVIGKECLEVHYQNVIFAVCKLIGLRVKAEYHTCNGRIDLLIETNDSVFIFEFKLNVSTKRAIRQIERKDYTAQFANDGRKVYKIGVNFSSRIRGIKDWKIAE